MTPKQQRFVEEYLIDLNATAAAIRAGYSKHTAHAIGQENLRKPIIAAAVREKQEQRSQRTEIDQDWVIEQLTTIAKRCMQAEPVIRDGKETGEFTFQPAPANRAVELLGKNIGMFNDKVELTGKDGGPIEYAELSDAERTHRIDKLLDAGRARRDGQAVNGGAADLDEPSGAAD